jgi:hypothetical protein
MDSELTAWCILQVECKKEFKGRNAFFRTFRGREGLIVSITNYA